MKHKIYKERHFPPSPHKKSRPAEAIGLYDSFRQGDLVFGLLEPRDVVIDQLGQRHYTHTYTNELNKKVVSMVVKKRTPCRKELQQLDSSQLKNFHFLSKHSAYLLRRPGKPVPLHADDDDQTLGCAFRRACKLLLINRDSDRVFRAHILTEGIDWERVCDKEKSKLGVTDSEMRAAFRDYKAHGKNPHILFYDAKLNLMDEAPWEKPDIKPMFEKYAREREAKKQPK